MGSDDDLNQQSSSESELRQPLDAEYFGPSKPFFNLVKPVDGS
jgi:hypothetical protein